eukprot:m.239909 g.239909  ORF g.239909 m.239909 type:complete len:1037 (-) comp22885_c0_seq1:27-3137(-)
MEFQVGAIVRIKLTNFVTYDHAEFHPGPGLNVVIGPNGTGKSSIVCAICIGLGGKLTLLGRQTEISGFVQNGKDKAEIELELKGSPHNTVITRTFARGAAQSTWMLDGVRAREKDVLARVASFNIHIDNLCQFLPQDMVPMFARMDPPQLLRRVEEAVGEGDLTGLHTRLEEISKTLAASKSELSKSDEHLKHLNSQNVALQAEVDRYHQRKAQHENIKIMEMKRSWLIYETTRKLYIDAKDERDRLQAQVSEKESENAPAVEALRAAEAATKELKAYCDSMNEKLGKEVKATNALQKALDDKREKLDELQQDLVQNEKTKKKNTASQEKVQADLERINAQIADLPNDEELKSRYNMKRDEHRSVQKHIAAMATQIDEMREEESAAQRKVALKTREKEDILNVKNARLNQLRQFRPDTYTAIMWLREHRDMFKKEIHEPIALVVNTPDTRDAAFVEQAISMSDMMTFVCEDSHDQELFLRETQDIQRLKINCGVDPGTPLASYRSPISPADMRKFGLRAFLSDLITAPDPVKRYLLEQSGLHNIPVGQTAGVEKQSDALFEARVTRFFSPDSLFIVKRSRYGNREIMLTMNAVRPPRYFGNVVNEKRLGEIDEELRAIKQEYESRVEATKTLQQQEKSERALEVRLRGEVEQLRQSTQQRDKLTAAQRRAAINLEDANKAIQQSMKDLKLIQSKLKGTLSDRVKDAVQLAHLSKKLVTMACERATSIVKLTQAIQTQAALERALTDANQALNALKARLAEVKADTEKYRLEARKTLERARASTGQQQPSPAQLQVFAGFPEDLPALEQAISDEQAKLDCSAPISESAIRDYEARKAQIEQKQAANDELQAQVGTLATELESVKEQWLPQLRGYIDRIRASFSAYFRDMGCAGDVILEEDETDFSKYGAKIMVKFRDDTQLQALTGTRQSGGERSVSTMLFLLALQSQTKVPFRVVDEINQGMDPNNERRVFSQVVKCSSEGVTSQYFLITPKLLPNLEYKGNLRVLCVFNGPHLMPGALPKLDVATVIARHKKTRA